MHVYTADYETTTKLDDCRVWAWAICDTENLHVEYGNCMETFIDKLRRLGNCEVWFHNLAFDGAFLFSWLETNGWTWDEKGKEPYTYTTCISDMNQVYMINLYFDARRKVKICDSLKILPMKVEAVAKAFDLDEGKGSIDYTEDRPIGHVLTQDEKDYIRCDVQITAKAVKRFRDEGLTKITIGSNALADCKTMMGGHRNFRSVFPLLTDEQDEFIRKGYKGGFTWVKPEHMGKIIGEGIVLDVNSLYPSVMKGCDGQLLPTGYPHWFDGSPLEDYPLKKKRPLWVACVEMTFDIKPDHIPCIQLKHGMRFNPREYIEHVDAPVVMIVTSVDWELITNQYYVQVIEWRGGYSFVGQCGIFADYVDKWTEVKIEAGKAGNKGLRQIAKLMLNSLYGKFATRTEMVGRRPVLDEDDVIHYEDLEPEKREGVYLPVGVFITAHARYKTIMAAQSVYDRFVYADTDSLHLLGTELPDCLEIDDFELGKWAHESTFNRAKFLRPKCYAEESEDGLDVKVAGMPEKCHSQVTLENLDYDTIYTGKLYRKTVKGGVVLYEGELKIRRQ